MRRSPKPMQDDRSSYDHASLDTSQRGDVLGPEYSFEQRVSKLEPIAVVSKR